jgi:hypothetical protein
MRTTNFLRHGAFAAASVLLASCAFHSTATHWNGRLDPDGRPVFVKTTTNVGMNLLVLLPLLGNTNIDTMLDATTAAIAEKQGNRVRVIQTSSENYWHGFPPFTWVVTPVITAVAVEYEPSAQEQVEAAAASRQVEQATQERALEAHQTVVPGEPPAQARPQGKR